uniref:Chromosome 19 open reading frame 44 n=1 Tax=Anas platyrhynchos TaxID=8839 RepID=A0A8B9SS61_ANAPL
MAASARAGRALVGGEQGHGDAQRWRTAGPSLLLPHSGSDLRVGEMGLEAAGRAPWHRSRFLKVQDVEVRGNQRCQALGGAVQAMNRGVAKSAPGGTAHTRSSSALRKVAQLESKIMNRKKQMELQNADFRQKPLDEESLSSASSLERSARGKKYLKNYTTASRNTAISNACPMEDESIQSPKKSGTVKQKLGLDTGKKEKREFTENSLEFPSGNENRRVGTSDSKWSGKSKAPVSLGTSPPSHKEISLTEVSKATSLHNKDLEKNVFGTVDLLTPPPASRNLSALRSMKSQSPSSMKDNTVKITLPRTGNAKQTQISLGSDGSEIKSLDDLFSKASDAEDSTSISSNDFRLNILSLDDLASNITSEIAVLKQKGTDIEITQESNRNPKKDTFQVEKDQLSLKISTVTGVSNPEGDTEKNVTEADISEHLDGEAVSEMSEEHSESSTYSGKDPSSSTSTPLRTRERHERVRRVTVKETAVQTVDSPFTYCWSKTNNTAVLGPPVGNSYIDPVPIASHIISMDAVEALTAYNPSVLVLNAMLKQHLMLTQQFVENIQHLHLCLVESLENEKFHYHTLEEAKEYIKNHKSPPLTLEQAREKIQKAQEEKLL